MTSYDDIDLSVEPYRSYLWGLDPVDTDPLHDDSCECIGEYLDDLEPDEWPEKLILIGHVRRKVNSDDVKMEEKLEWIYETLDENHGPDDELVRWDSEPSPLVRAKARQLAELIASEYVSWQCDEVVGAQFEVDVQSWVRECAPEMLEE